MSKSYKGLALGALDVDNLTGCIAASDAALKTADVHIQGIITKRMKSGGVVLIRGTISNVNSAIQSALSTAKALGKIVNYTVIPSPTENDEELLAVMVKQ